MDKEKNLALTSSVINLINLETKFVDVHRIANYSLDYIYVNELKLNYKNKLKLGVRNYEF